MFSTRERCLLAWLPCELETPMVESADRRALDSEAACLRLSSTSCIFTCFLCSSMRSRWYAISRTHEAPTGRILLPATTSCAWFHPSSLRWITRLASGSSSLGGGIGFSCFRRFYPAGWVAVREHPNLVVVAPRRFG